MEKMRTYKSSPILSWISRYLATQRSIHTASPFWRSGSRYFGAMHCKGFCVREQVQIQPDHLLVASCSEFGVHVCHHLDLKLLHQLHLGLVQLRHRHLDSNLSFRSGDQQSLGLVAHSLPLHSLDDALLGPDRGLPLLENAVPSEHKGADTSDNEGRPTDVYFQHVTLAKSPTSHNHRAYYFCKNFLSH